MLACTAFYKEFHRNISQFSYLYYNCRQTYKKIEEKHAWKNGYNFVHTVTFKVVFLIVNISECIYGGCHLAYYSFFRSLTVLEMMQRGS